MSMGVLDPFEVRLYDIGVIENRLQHQRNARGHVVESKMLRKADAGSVNQSCLLSRGLLRGNS